MKRKAVILQPVDTQSVRMKPSYATDVEAGLDPWKRYSSTIETFKDFAVGPFFWFILDFSTWRHVRGGGAIRQMTPLTEQDFIDTDNAVLAAFTHPDDVSSVMAFTDFFISYYAGLPEEKRKSTRANLYFRIQNPWKEYYWVMVQYRDGILNDKNHWMYGLAMVTDISHIKKEGLPMMSILDVSDETSQQFFYTGQEHLRRIRSKSCLTKREVEVLQYLSKGFSSKQIADALDLSVKTIDNHRQNMLHKTNTKSSAELLNHCIQLGYLFF